MGPVLSTDCVFDEGMTLIRIRKKSRPLLERFQRLFWGPWTETRPFGILSTTEDDYREAGRFQIQHFDQELSLTDCTLILHARARDAVVATFDSRFNGLIGTAARDSLK
jgi:predicted nucleic acid-binding protein